MGRCPEVITESEGIGVLLAGVSAAYGDRMVQEVTASGFPRYGHSGTCWRGTFEVPRIERLDREPFAGLDGDRWWAAPDCSDGLGVWCRTIPMVESRTTLLDEALGNQQIRSLRNGPALLEIAVRRQLHAEEHLVENHRPPPAARFTAEHDRRDQVSAPQGIWAACARVRESRARQELGELFSANEAESRLPREPAVTVESVYIRPTPWGSEFLPRRSWDCRLVGSSAHSAQLSSGR